MNEPKLLVPYPGPDASGNTIDLFIYLRPETNGVLTESVMMRTIVENPDWKSRMKMVYMANYPGDFIQTRHLIEHHYRVKLAFARAGGKAFTAGMRADFESYFQTPFDESRVIGAFDAMERTGWDYEKLFAYRVPQAEMLVSLGQNIKRMGDFWIVNYDMPAILQQNNSETDIAVMVFRLSLSWSSFAFVVEAMGKKLVESGIIDPETPLARAFHYSKSPFEQLLDGIDFLWGVDVSDGGAEDDISFGAYLMDRGFSRDKIRSAVRTPLVIWKDDAGTHHEGNLFEMTSGMNYPAAEAMWKKAVGPLIDYGGSASE